MDIEVKSPLGNTRILRLFDVAFCKGIVCNLVSLCYLCERGFYWDNRLKTTLLKCLDGSTLCSILEKHDQFILEYIPEDVNRAAFFTRRNKFNTWIKRKPQRVEVLIWHLRLGHPGPQSLEHLVNSSQGMQIKGITTIEGDACVLAKAKCQI